MDVWLPGVLTYRSLEEIKDLLFWDEGAIANTTVTSNPPMEFRCNSVKRLEMTVALTMCMFFQKEKHLAPPQLVP